MVDIRSARLNGFYVSGIGLEIAPYFNPMLTKEKFNVLYTDYISNEEIKKKASENPTLNGRDVPDIDFVWTPGMPLASCAPVGVSFDYALASHVMEHVPNPIGWLNDILAVMKVGAPLRLILPDRRRTNDFYRKETSVAQLISWWLHRPSIPTTEQIADFLLESLDDREKQGFSEDGIPISKRKAYSAEEAINVAEFSYNERTYLDVHCSVWTNEHFVSVMEKIVELGILNVDIAPSSSFPMEFTVDVIKKGEPRRLPSQKLYREIPADFDISAGNKTDAGNFGIMRRLISLF